MCQGCDIFNNDEAKKEIGGYTKWLKGRYSRITGKEKERTDF